MTAEKAEQILMLIHTTDIYEPLQGVDLIIEAVFENPKLKASVTQEAEKFLREDGDLLQILPLFLLQNWQKLPKSKRTL
jgi:3-hydroxyacyl-CoA dehydrogenase